MRLTSVEAHGGGLSRCGGPCVQGDAPGALTPVRDSASAQRRPPATLGRARRIERDAARAARARRAPDHEDCARDARAALRARETPPPPPPRRSPFTADRARLRTRDQHARSDSAYGTGLPRSGLRVGPRASASSSATRRSASSARMRASAWPAAAAERAEGSACRPPWSRPWSQSSFKPTIHARQSASSPRSPRARRGAAPVLCCGRLLGRGRPLPSLRLFVHRPWAPERGDAPPATLAQT